MFFKELRLQGAYIIEMEKLEDERGFFARTWCENEFKQQGLMSRTVQANISHNNKKGTLRGLHYQTEPYAEDKLIRCTRGAIYDVIIDINPRSPTYKNWISVELAADKYQMIYIPKLFAHGFQTLVDNTEVFYQMSEFYKPDVGRGIRYNDPTFDIKWPLDAKIISAKDESWPDFLS